MPKTPVHPTKGADHYTVKRKFNLNSARPFVSNQNWSLDNAQRKKIKISSLIKPAESVC